MRTCALELSEFSLLLVSVVVLSVYSATSFFLICEKNDISEPALQLLFNIYELSFKAQLLNEFYGAELYIIKQRDK